MIAENNNSANFLNFILKSKDFIDFVKGYLLPDSGLLCSPEELYSARCGLLHCNTAESNISRSGKARHLIYAVGISPEENGYEHVRPESRDTSLVVSIDKLSEAYVKSIEKLNQKISQEDNFADLIYRRSTKLYAHPIE